jgi:putative ABC transport system ATP-binding protein
MSAEAQTAPAIALEGIHKRYRTGRLDVHALRGIDLVIEPGELVAVVGPSGSGKTTLMEIMGCLSRPSEGTYRIHGERTEAIAPEGLARLRGRELGFIFQSFNLLPRLSVAENVELPLLYARVPRRERRERALRVLALVGLDERAHHRPTEISGGERQRVAIARALVNEPTLVLADEPTGNLDTERGQEILEILERVHAGGATIVIVTHDPGIAGRARRRITIRDGAIESDTGASA